MGFQRILVLLELLFRVVAEEGRGRGEALSEEMRRETALIAAQSTHRIVMLNGVKHLAE